MKARVNLRLLSTTTFDSGALGMLAMVLHQFTAAGYYRAAVVERGRMVTDLSFEVDPKSEVMQLDIDLARAAREAGTRPGGCGCKGEQPPARVVSPRGYVLFHASSGAGYAVTVSHDGDRVGFDSTKLSDGDLFAVSPLEPATYSVKNMLGSAAGKLTVGLTPEQLKEIRTLDTRYVDVSEKKLDPDRVDLVSSQGLVFRIKGAARVRIEKEHPQRNERPGPGIRWRKHGAIPQTSPDR
jgi:hypothetical protein